MLTDHRTTPLLVEERFQCSLIIFILVRLFGPTFSLDPLDDRSQLCKFRGHKLSDSISLLSLDIFRITVDRYNHGSILF